MRLRSITTAVLMLALTAPAVGGRDKLQVGSPAPGLDIDTWVKGDEVTLESGKVYVVEFWATWCPPCRKSIPQLSELQETHGTGQLTIIGISDEPADKIKPFVRRQGDNMDYTVAADRRKSTHRAWMRAAGLQGIPAAFIVDRTLKIAWIGNPLDEDFDDALAGVISGRYDPELQAQAAPILRTARQSRNMRNWRMALQHYDQVIELDQRIFADIAVERFVMMLLDMKATEQAYDYARKQLVEGVFASDAGALRMLAYQISTNPKIDQEDRDLDLALEAATLALAMDGDRDPAALSTAALVHYHRGEIDQAIRLQSQAYFLARPNAKAGYKRVLASYREAAMRSSASMNPG